MSSSKTNATIKMKILRLLSWSNITLIMQTNLNKYYRIHTSKRLWVAAKQMQL